VTLQEPVRGNKVTIVFTPNTNDVVKIDAVEVDFCIEGTTVILSNSDRQMC